MNDQIERVLAELDGFRMADEMDYPAYSRLHDCISELDDLVITPRLLTPEELFNVEVVFLEEYCDPEDGVEYIIRPAILISSKNGCVNFLADMGDETDVWLLFDEYGKTWRCWNSKPTDEQREAVKWE